MENTSKALVMEIFEKKGFDFLMLISIGIIERFIFHDTNTPWSVGLLLELDGWLYNYRFCSKLNPYEISNIYSKLKKKK